MQKPVLASLFILLILSGIIPAFAQYPTGWIPPTNAYSHVKASNGTINAKNYDGYLNFTGGGTVSIFATTSGILITSIGGSGSTLDTMQNIGTGQGSIYAGNTSNTNFQFKTLKAGTGITITNNTQDVTISNSGNGITSINTDSTPAQTLQGTSRNVTVTNAGATHTWNLGDLAVVTNGAAQTITKALTLASLILSGNANGGGFSFTNLNFLNATKIFQNGNQAIDTLVQGSGISITGSGNTRTITNTGILNAITSINLQNGPGVSIVRGSSKISITNNTNSISIDTSTLSSAITSINTDITPAQTLQGTSRNVTVTNSGATHTWNLGDLTVITNGLAQVFSSGKKLTFSPSSTTAGINITPSSSDITSPRKGDLRIVNSQIKFNDNSNNTFFVPGQANCGVFPSGLRGLISYSASSNIWSCQNFYGFINGINTEGKANFTNGNPNVLVTSTDNGIDTTIVKIFSNNTAQCTNLLSTGNTGNGVCGARQNATNIGLKSLSIDPTLTISNNSTNVLLNVTGVKEDPTYYVQGGSKFWYSYHDIEWGQTSLSMSSANTTYAFPWKIGKGYNSDQIGFEVTNMNGATHGRCMVGIYNDTGSVYPNVLQVTGSDQAFTTTGTKTNTVSLQFKSNEMYWAVINCSTSTPQLRATTSTLGELCYIGSPNSASSFICGTNYSTASNHPSSGFSFPHVFTTGLTASGSGNQIDIVLRAK